jgi:hypothetical protein
MGRVIGPSLGYFSFTGRWVAKLVARLLAKAALSVRIQSISQKYKMGDISKGGPSHSSLQKIYKKTKQFIFTYVHKIPVLAIRVTYTSVGISAW